MVGRTPAVRVSGGFEADRGRRVYRASLHARRFSSSSSCSPICAGRDSPLPDSLLLETLRDKFRIRLFEAIGGAGTITLFTDGKEVFARTATGEFINLLRAPDQPMLVVGDVPMLRELTARTKTLKKKRKVARKSARRLRTPSAVSRSERPCRGPQPAGESRARR